MAKLTAKKRNKLKTSSFALKKQKKYPIHDKAHAVAALAYSKQHATPAEQKTIKKAVCKRYPGLPACGGGD